MTWKTSDELYHGKNRQTKINEELFYIHGKQNNQFITITPCPNQDETKLPATNFVSSLNAKLSPTTF